MVRKIYNPATEGNDFSRTATLGEWEETPVSKVFFSKINMDALQIGIRTRINRQTGVDIGRQSDPELKAYMRWAYMEKIGRHDGKLEEIVNEVKRLNGIILDRVVPSILNSIRYHNSYLEDLKRSPAVIDHPETTSVRGTKQIRMDNL